MNKDIKLIASLVILGLFIVSAGSIVLINNGWLNTSGYVNKTDNKIIHDEFNEE